MYKIKFYKSDIIIIVSFLLMILTYFYPLAQIGWFMFWCFSIALVFSWKAPKELIYLQLFFVLQFQHYVSSQILPNTVSYFNRNALLGGKINMSFIITFKKKKITLWNKYDNKIG